MSNTITLIQCTNSKRGEAAPAQKLYDKSTYFNKMRAWAETRGDPWYILSAKHGLVDPQTVIKPYDERGISESQATEISADVAQIGVKTVHMTAGMAYTDPLVPKLEQRGIDVVNHFAGQRIGERMSSIDQVMQNNAP